MKLKNPEIRFEVTNICNANCIMCPREKMKRSQGVLDMDLYKKVLDESLNYGVTQVSLENYGEPFMDPFLIERIKYAKEKGLLVFTITNGSFLDEKKCEDVIKAGLDKIRISMYGITKEVYEKIHIGLCYEKVTQNIDNLFNIRKKAGVSTPKIEMYFLVLDENKEQVKMFRDKWENIADSISVWKPHNWSDGRGYRPVNPDKKTCGRPETGPIQVQWDGLVVPCCFDYDSRIVLGDLKHETLADVITGLKYNELRRAHRERNFTGFSFCNNCDQLYKREDVLIYSNIKDARVGASNTNYFQLDKENR